MTDNLRYREHISAVSPFQVGTYFREWPNGSQTETIVYSRNGTELGKPDSERTWDYTNPGPPYRSGSSFLNYKGRHEGNDVRGTCHIRVGYLASTTLNYIGGFVPNSFGPSAFSAASLEQVGVSGPFSGSYGSPSPYATSAYNNAKPKISNIDTLRSLVELRELPASVKGSVGAAKELYRDLGGVMNTPFMNPKTVANEFTNHSFGWLPTLSDALTLAKMHNRAHDTIERIKRSNGVYGKVGRRIVDSEDYILTGTTYTPLVFPALNGFLYQTRSFEGHSCIGYTRHYNVQLNEVWFEGSFMYYLPEFDMVNPSAYGQISRLLRLARAYGIKLSPVTLYDLMPWTWLADYFSNLGDLYEGVTSLAFDPVVNKYAFIMRHVREKRVNESNMFFRDGQTIGAGWAQEVESKQRKRATPFGFDVDMGNLSPTQAAILLALGIGRT